MIVKTDNAIAGTSEGSGIFEHGEIVDISASPNIDYDFLRWGGEGVFDPLLLETKILMDQAREVIAFLKVMHRKVLKLNPMILIQLLIRFLLIVKKLWQDSIIRG